MTAAAPGRVPTPARLTPGARVGGLTVGAALRTTAITELYQAEGPSGACTLHVVHPQLARDPRIRDAVLAGAARARALDPGKHLIATLDAGADAQALWVATESVDGNTIRDLLARKRQAGGGGFGARGAGNLLIGVAGALHAHAVHGALSADSVVVQRTGLVRLADLALGPAEAAAIAAGLLPGGSHIAPEVAKGAPPTEAADVYGLGALLYEALVGRPLERGGPRPSEAVPGLTPQIDELIARMCASAPERRFGSVEVVKELVADALGRGAAIDDEQQRASASSASRPSLAQAITAPAEAAASSGGFAVAVDPALQAALADSTEHWLISKGRLDYGPFSLKDILEQIRKGEIVAGNIIVDKDTGQRVDVGKHPLLGAMVDAARQALDDARRAQAEIHHEKTQKKRGTFLFAMIGAIVVVLGVAIYIIVGQVKGKRNEGAIAGVEKVGGAQLSVTFSQPKKPPKQPRRAGGGGSRRGGGDNGDAESLALDMSGDDDDSGSETLDLGTIYNVYSRYGSQLGRCMSRAGESYALISIIIDGPSGKVTFVRVNGQKGGGLAECIGGVMRTMKFPAVNGTRTRAEFDINL